MDTARRGVREPRSVAPRQDLWEPALSPSCLTCNNPPDSVGGRHACGGVRAATAAPWPVSAARLTGRAWPAAGGPLTWGAGWPQAGLGGRGCLPNTKPPLVQKGQGSGPRRRLARRSGWRRASPREGQGATHQGPLEQGGPPEQRGDPSTAPRGSLLPQAPAMCPQSSLPEPQFTISACHFCIVRPLSHWLLRIHCHPYLLPCSHSGAEGICLPGPQVDSRYTEGRAGRKDERGQQTRTPTQL